MKQGNIQSYIQKLFLGIAFSFLFSFTGVAQMENPVHWSYSTKKISADQVDLIMTAQIDKDWHVYTQFFPAGGPIRLTFNFEKSKDYKLVGKVKETPKPHKEHDEIFGIDVAYTKGKAIFTQTINALSKEPFTIKVSIEGQACYELDGKCIVVEGENIFNIDGNTSAAGVDNQAGDTTSVKVDSDTTSTQENDSNLFKVPVQVIHVNPNNNQQETSNNTPAEQSLLIFFLVALGAGLLGAVTPCVFPMIPMTVTFFMNTSGSRSKTLKLALFYGFSIVALYTAIGAIVALTSVNSNFANQISTNWIVNLVFFLLFMVFAASFFGMFELTLPGSLATKADQQVDKGGYVGAFFMALTLVIVSFSCTGPIIGVILVQAAGGAVLKPILGMLGFSLTFALPFTLFAAFPSLLQKLPKSGGWLNAVKVVLGFVVLALGMKFLSAVDMGLQLNILDREVFIAIWIVLFAMLGFYLLGKLKFAHDSDLPYISVPRLLMAIISFAFVVYLLPGLVGAPLKGVSAFLPSETTHDFDLKAIIRDNSGGTAEKPQNLCDQPKYADFLKLPHGLKGYFDYEQGLACAKQLNKPLFVDFTGHGCANCKEMEMKVWSDPQVIQRLQSEFVIVSLYVDDQFELSESESYTSTQDGKLKNTIGKKNSDFRINRFQTNTQPFYVILDTDGNQIGGSYTYNLSVSEFVDYLDNGLSEFNQKLK